MAIQFCTKRPIATAKAQTVKSGTVDALAIRIRKMTVSYIVKQIAMPLFFKNDF